jgi:hypothetical protein
MEGSDKGLREKGMEGSEGTDESQFNESDGEARA